MSCVNPNNPEFQELVRKTGNYLLAEIEYTKGSPVIQSNGKMINLPEEAKQKIYDNYVNAGDTIFLTLGVTLAATDVVTVRAGTADTSFSLFGSEIA